MIFVTVGMHSQGFERLIRKMDEVALKLNKEVIMQIGTTKYEPKNTKWFRFVELDEEILELIDKSDLVISHGGAGTILTVLAANKPLIVVPRLQCFNEHVDNQQLELTDYLSEQGRLVTIKNVNEIENSIECIINGEYNNKFGNKYLVNHLKNSISRCAN